MNPATMTLTEVGAAVLGIVALVGTWMKVVRPAVRLIQLMVGFLDDWNGEPERRDSSGQVVEKARPGWRGRLAAMEHELHPNSGSSIKDTVDRTEVKLQELGQQVERLAAVDAADRQAASQAHRAIHERIDRYVDRDRGEP